MAVGDPVTPIEAAFLAMEKPGLPMHVAGVLLVHGDPPVTIAEVREQLESRLRRLPRFRQRLSRGRWVRARRVDLKHHVWHHSLNGAGTMPQLRELCARIHEQPLHRDRPLWEVHLIDGLHGHDQAVVVKTHHAITDGIAGVEVAEALLDREPAWRCLDQPVPSFGQHSQHSGLAAALQSVFGAAVTAAGGPIALDSPFNGPVGPRRSFAVTDIPLRVVREAKHRFGCTVDDVVVAIAAAGLGAYLRETGYPDPPRSLRAMLPVSTCAGRPGGLGNHVTAVFVDLPMNVDDLHTLVQVIASEKSILRTAHAAAGVEMIVRATGLLPGALQRSLVRLAAGQRGANLVLSDVPAPDAPMFLLGRRITGTYPMMPLGGDIGLSIAVLGMAGKLCVGVTVDPDLVPGAQRVAKAIESVVSDLEFAMRHRAHAA
jgi:diacylglycerol O-acyltransferase / wax synthase